MYYVYILRCNNGATYTGCTKDLKDRFQRHINGYVPATKPQSRVLSCRSPSGIAEGNPSLSAEIN